LGKVEFRLNRLLTVQKGLAALAAGLLLLQ